jgi:hypothetical protein
VRVVQDAACLVQPLQEPGAAPGGAGRDSLAAGERTRAVGEMLGAQQVAANGARKEIVRRGGGSGEQAGEAERGQTGTGGFGPIPDTQGRQVSDDLRRTLTLQI